ncbi:MAG: hypothetical protein A2Y48_00835 [Nitrospirae bacterium RIFCSPLOW2_12_42_9]|nr:MAG: hypothetical protein A3D21_02975 [Nitrospirae bacterium RIFCSPHIGHO2_02_FULL_42_12]OGW56527.1 MAG: hypothetical protein A2Y48_00835 [Nitrospirae bacterium RIFCSPLOW2_12_42_9]
MEKIKVFFDTNVLVYAHDELSPFHKESAELLDMAIEGVIEGVISEQNLMELYRIFTNSTAMRGNPLTPVAVKLLFEETYLNGSFGLIYPTRDIMFKTISIASAINAISAKIFDVRIAAQALSANVTYLVTYNINDIVGVEGLTSMLPGEIITVVQGNREGNNDQKSQE